MKITILTTFPEMFAPLHTSILGRAEKAGLLEIREVDIRQYAANKHHNTDDSPFGGGAGMVMLAQPIVDAIRDVQGDHFEGKRIYLSPRGKTLRQADAEQYAKEKELILLCGHYEGVDQRAIDLCIDEEVSIGDYVLTGGELPAMVLVDCIARLVPGVLGCGESAENESFSSGLLEYPQYTRPREFEGLTVPEPLLNGNHREIEGWQFKESLYITLKRRPEMATQYLQGLKLTKSRKKLVDAVYERLRIEEEAAANLAEAKKEVDEPMPDAPADAVGMSGTADVPAVDGAADADESIRAEAAKEGWPENDCDTCRTDEQT